MERAEALREIWYPYPTLPPHYPAHTAVKHASRTTLPIATGPRPSPPTRRRSPLAATTACPKPLSSMPPISLLALHALQLAAVTMATVARQPVCTQSSTFAHPSVARPFSPPVPVAVPLVLYFRCDENETPLASRRRSLLVLGPGALLRASDYSQLATVLARRGFVTAVPQYDSRVLFSLSPLFGSVQMQIEGSLEEGFDCPRNGQFPSVRMLASALAFLAGDELPGDIRRLYDVDDVIIFAHSASGPLSERLFTDTCAPFSSPVSPPPRDLSAPPLTSALIERIFCEQFEPADIPSNVTIQGVISYEGTTEDSVISVTDRRFWAIIHSPFFENVVNDFVAGRNFRGRLAVVRIGSANHYGPVDFVSENQNQRPVCAIVRPPPEDMYASTAATQRRVIRSIAATVVALTRGSERVEGLLGKDHLDVDNVTFV